VRGVFHTRVFVQDFHTKVDAPVRINLCPPVHCHCDGVDAIDSTSSNVVEPLVYPRWQRVFVLGVIEGERAITEDCWACVSSQERTLQTQTSVTERP